MKTAFKARKKLVLLSLPIVLLFAATFYIANFGPILGHLAGTWETGDGLTITRNIFKPNGEFESVTTFLPAFADRFGSPSNSDGSGVGTPLVFRGNYSVSGYTFRTFNLKRYIRENGQDVLFVIRDDATNNSFISDSETMQLDQEASDPKNFATVASADWIRGIIKVRSSNPSNTTITIWTRQ